MTYSEWLNKVADLLANEGYTVRIAQGIWQPPQPPNVTTATILAYKDVEPSGVIGAAAVSSASESFTTRDPAEFVNSISGLTGWTMERIDYAWQWFLTSYSIGPARVRPANFNIIMRTPNQLQTNVGKPATTTPATTPGEPPPKGDPAVPIHDQIVELATSSMATNTLNWDQWNYFYLAVTGSNAPAPEARGFTREENGLVRVNGVTQFDFDTWAQAAGVATTLAQPQSTPTPAPRRQLSPAVAIAAIAVGELILRKLMQ